MITDGFEQWLKLNKNLNTPITEWGKASSELYRHLSEENIEILNETLSRVAEQMKRLSNVRSPEDLLNLQKECISEDVHAMIKHWQKISHLQQEGVEECIKSVSGTLHESTKGVVERSREKDKERV